MLLPLFGGLAAFGFGEGLLVQSQWGASPWTVFAQGVAKHASISLGWSTALISVVVLVVWIPLRQRPGFGTISNVIIIAYVLDLTTYAVAAPHADWLKALYVLGAVVSIGVGSAFYLTCNLGPGPRDGLMTGLHNRLQRQHRLHPSLHRSGRVDDRLADGRHSRFRDGVLRRDDRLQHRREFERDGASVEVAAHVIGG